MAFIPTDKLANIERDDLLLQIIIRLDLVIRHLEEVTDLDHDFEELSNDDY